MIPWLHSLRALLPALVLALAACRSTRAEPIGQPLPFHVAVQPTEIIPSVAEGEPEMKLEIDRPGVLRALADGLQARGFSRVTMLEVDEAEQARLDGLTSAQKDQRWQERARAVGADLLLRTTLSYEEKIDTEINDRFWLNLPLFLLGGPMCWFVDDRSYAAAARLQADFYDVSDVHAALEQWALLPLPLYVEFDETGLDFLDRADGAGDYALSFLIPAGLLSRSSDKVAEQVADEFLADLGEQLVTKVHAERSRFEANRSLWAFGIEGDQARAQRNADGTVSVAVPLREVDQETPLYRYEIRAADTLLRQGEFEAAEPDGRHWVKDSVPLDAAARFVSLRVEDERNRARSYTLAIR